MTYYVIMKLCPHCGQIRKNYEICSFCGPAIYWWIHHPDLVEELGVEDQEIIRDDDGNYHPRGWVKDNWHGDGRYHPYDWVHDNWHGDGRYYPIDWVHDNLGDGIYRPFGWRQ